MTQSLAFNFACYIAITAFCVWLILLLLRLADRVRGKTPTPSNENLSLGFQNHEERIKRMENWRDHLTEKMESDKNQILQSGSHRGRTIFERIEATRREIDTKINSLEEKIEDMPERIVNLLRNIKTLGS